MFLSHVDVCLSLPPFLSKKSNEKEMSLVEDKKKSKLDPQNWLFMLGLEIIFIFWH